MREATTVGGLPIVHIGVSIHASHAGGDQDGCQNGQRRVVSIHASHAGGDYKANMTTKKQDVSIHASHAGGDSCWLSSSSSVFGFNPRLPCGRRPFPKLYPITKTMFQSTPPMREATTPHFSLAPGHVMFQSTPPMREATDRDFIVARSSRFQSTPPMREATIKQS